MPTTVGDTSIIIGVMSYNTMEFELFCAYTCSTWIWHGSRRVYGIQILLAMDLRSDHLYTNRDMSYGI